ncbi:methyltransferase family protein [Brevundimonas goettingensis]|uniref:Isoprenylcysteine carboxylmethyltransferase family protein n=1 Tax=Brevundimonas goettingensis TaxID=2774190 RepID=A0A975C141_9CAUL|nr:isoprenylcysteine carboxylmethyltransferase family protein [Brevundimonas goettingensis]QTC91953.1 isoprenylcysteine carboxylmethyltransferase family protein [Brevundimonas goettingensis]
MPLPQSQRADDLSTPASSEESAALRRVQLRRKALLAVVLVLFVGAAAVIRPLAEETILHALLVGVGQFAIFAAIVGRGWCSLYIGGRKTHEIVRRGPYSVSRNPLYVFSFLAAFGVGAQTGSLILALGALALTFVVMQATVLREEAFLCGVFGTDYEGYRATTPRYWPRWSLWRDDRTLEIDPCRFVTTILDGAIMLAAIPLLAALSGARFEGLIPTLLTLP